MILQRYNKGFRGSTFDGWAQVEAPGSVYRTESHSTLQYAPRKISYEHVIRKILCSQIHCHQLIVRCLSLCNSRKRLVGCARDPLGTDRIPTCVKRHRAQARRVRTCYMRVARKIEICTNLSPTSSSHSISAKSILHSSYPSQYSSVAEETSRATRSSAESISLNYQG